MPKMCMTKEARGLGLTQLPRPAAQRADVTLQIPRRAPAWGRGASRWIRKSDLADQRWTTRVLDSWATCGSPSWATEAFTVADRQRV